MISFLENSVSPRAEAGEHTSLTGTLIPGGQLFFLMASLDLRDIFFLKWVDRIRRF